nr:MAG TPA: Protein of unknown function (DUF1351) [Caudoviricetes sp.]
MTNELIPIKSSVDIQPFLQNFKIDENYMKSLEENVNTFLETSKLTVVTEETLAANKKYVADLNKKVASLKMLKKQAKDVVLTQLDTLNEQVEYLIEKISEADTLVRDQTKRIDEQRKEELEKEVLEQFNGYCESYDFKLFDFETFLRYNPIKLSTTLNKYKVAIIEFIERTTNEFEMLQTLTDNTDVLNEYKRSVEFGRLNNALTLAKQSHEQNKAVREEIKKEVRQEIKKDNFIIELTNETDYKRVVTYLKKYNITFKENN